MQFFLERGSWVWLGQTERELAIFVGNAAFLRRGHQNKPNWRLLLDIQLAVMIYLGHNTQRFTLYKGLNLISANVICGWSSIDLEICRFLENPEKQLSQLALPIAGTMTLGSAELASGD